MRTFMREKKIYCGENYREVDIFPYSTGQKAASRRGKRSKKKNETPPKQRNLNDKNARRYLVQLGELNFGSDPEALHVTLTYSEANLPPTVEAAEKEITNFLRRVRYRREEEKLPPLKYILVTSYSTGEGGEKPTRIHHHVLMNGGLDRNVIEDLWRKRKRKGQKQGDRIGFCNADRVQPNENGITALCNYLFKQPGGGGSGEDPGGESPEQKPEGKGKKRGGGKRRGRPAGKKRWSCSKNLKRPQSRTNDGKFTRRQVEGWGKNHPPREFWEKKYPGWTLTDPYNGVTYEYNETTGWSVYLKLRKKE